MVSGTRCPYVSLCGCEVVRGAAALKGRKKERKKRAKTAKDVLKQ